MFLIMKTSFAKKLIKIILSLMVGLTIVWVLYHKTDFEELWEIIESANFKIILLSLIFGLFGNILRALRWELFIHSLGYRPQRSSLIYATLGNFAVNFLLPRGGDIWRCGIVSKNENIPFAKTFETFLVDKFVEIISGLLIIIASIVLYVDFFYSYFRHNPHYGEALVQFFTSPWVLLALALIVVVVVLSLTVFKTSSLIRKAISFFRMIKKDIKIIMQMKNKGRVFLYTLLIWINFYLYFYLCFFAFDFTKGLGAAAGLIVFAMSNIGISVPVQGGIGAWHVMVISSLVILGVSKEQANAFAGTVFTIQSAWIILCGLVGIFALPYVKRRKIRKKSFEASR